MLYDIISSAVGAFLGVIAGIAVTITVQNIIAAREEKQKISNLITEIDFNISKIGDLIEKSNRLRQAIAEDRFHQFFEDFDVSKVFKVTLIQLITSGKIHTLLSREQIKQIYGDFDIFFSLASENFLRDRLNTFRKAFTDILASGSAQATQELQTTKQGVLGFHDYINKKLTSNKSELSSMKKHLESQVNLS